jgi:hydrogenase nickel incorporation protein HypA/HybF
MHELSVASSIIEIIQRSVPPESHRSIQSVNIRVGEQAGVVPDSLLFYFDILRGETDFKNARLLIEEVPFLIFCASCDKTLSSDTGFLVCPECGGTRTRVVSGTEMQVVDIELNSEDPDEPHHH